MHNRTGEHGTDDNLTKGALTVTHKKDRDHYTYQGGAENSTGRTHESNHREGKNTNQDGTQGGQESSKQNKKH